MDDLSDLSELIELKPEYQENPPKNKSEGTLKKTFISGHLSSPIYAEECDFIEQMERPTCFRHKKLRQIYERSGKPVQLVDVIHDPHGFLENWIMEQPINVPQALQHFWSIKTTSFKSLLIHKINLLEPHIRGDILTRDLIETHLSKVESIVDSRYDELFTDFVNMKKVEILKDKICFKEIDLGSMISSYPNLMVERDICILKTVEQSYILPTSLLLCALDKIQSYFGLKLYWLICDALGKYPNHSILTRGSELIKIFRTLRTQLGNDFFTFVACWESLMIGWTILDPTDSGFDKLYLSQIEEMSNILASNNSEFDILSLLPTNRIVYNTLMHLELTGMIKIFGYPILSAHHLLDQMRDYGTHNNFPINLSTVRAINGLIKRDFIYNYKSRTSHMPNFITVPPELSILLTNRLPDSSFFNNYELWNAIKFDKSLDYDFTPDVSELIKDSSAALPLNLWYKNYDRCSWKYLYNKSPPQSFFKKEHICTRVVDAYLKTTEQDLAKYLKERDEGTPHTEDKIAVECGKECELKISGGRSFTKQTPDQRLLQTSMEMNIAKSIFPFVPEQSMTDPEILNLRRIMDQVTHMDGGNEIIVLDIKKWNIVQRHMCTYKLGVMYDELFGFNQLFTNSHLWFVNCNIFINNRLFAPDYQGSQPIPGPFYMNQYIGGMEGMQQKKWTHFTIGVVKFTLEKNKVNGTVMAQGDNVVIIVHYKRDQMKIKNEIREQLMSDLTLRFREVNMELKEKETWYSQHLHEYGKTRIFKGASVSYGTKKASKLIPDINDGLFSIPSSCATINTMTEAIAKADGTGDAAFLLNQVLMLNYLWRKNLYSKDRSLSQLFFPTDFGGLPLSTYFNHIIRGHSDKITLWISIFLTIKRNFSSTFNQLMMMIKVTPMEKPVSYVERSRLYEDPFCLNVRSLPSAENKIREHTLNYLKSDEVVNIHVKRLYDDSTSMKYDAIIQEVDKIEPMFVQIAHKLLSLSNAGLLKMLQNKLTSVKTIESIVQQYENKSFLKIIKDANTDLTRVYNQILRSNLINPESQIFYTTECPTKIAKILREKNWNKDFINLSKAPPQHQMTVFKEDSVKDLNIRNRSILITLSHNLLNNNKAYRLEFGPYPPYIGSTTHEKIRKPTMDIVNQTTHVKALKNLGTTLSWAQIVNSKNLQAFIMDLIKEKFVFAPEEITLENIPEWCRTVHSGNIYHRFMSQVESRYSILNGLTSITTHYKQSTNLMKEMTSEGQDYSIYYQLIYIYNMASLCVLAEMGIHLSPSYLSQISCFDECTEEFGEVKFDIVNYSGFSPTPNEAENMRLTSTLDAAFLKAVQEIVTGSILAENIDRNYQIVHENLTSHEKINEIKKEALSINDFKCLDLYHILLTMCTHSVHIRDLYNNSTNLLLQISSDSSYTFFCEFIINSGNLDYFIFLMGQKPNEHKMLTTPSKLSNFIGRNIRNFIQKNIYYIVQSYFKFHFIVEAGRLNSASTLLWIARLALQNEQISKSDYRKCKSFFSYNSELSWYDIYKLFKIPGRRIVAFDFYQIMTQWRSTPRYPHNPKILAFEAVKNVGELFTFNEFSALTGFYNNAFANDNNDAISVNFLGHIVRLLGDISSAAQKYIELFSYFNFLSQQLLTNKFILCLAEGSGSVMAILGQLFPSARLGYNTLIRSDIDNRFDPTNHFPPTKFTARIPSERFPYQIELACGETNILTDDFIEKLTSLITRDPPFIVTMDAESMTKGSNIEFCKKLVPIFVSAEVSIVIFKCFYNEFFPKLVQLHCMYLNYDTFLLKPYCSNPLSKEIFLVLVKSDAVNYALGRSLRSLESATLNYLSRQKLTWDGIHEYLTCRFTIIAPIKDLIKDYPHLRITEIYDTCGIGSCGINCINHLSRLMETLDLIHSSIANPAVNIVIRQSGTNQSIQRIIPEFVFSFLNHFGDKKPPYDFLILAQMYPLSLNDNIGQLRAEVSREGSHYSTGKILNFPPIPFIQVKTDKLHSAGDMINNWPLCKTYLRHYFNSPRCSCEHPTVRYWSRSQRWTSLSNALMINMCNLTGVKLEQVIGSLRVEISMDAYDILKQEYPNQYSINSKLDNVYLEKMIRDELEPQQKRKPILVLE